MQSPASGPFRGPDLSHPCSVKKPLGLCLEAWPPWSRVVPNREAGILECTSIEPGLTFLTKRFDRAGEGRIHFASALTLLGRKDGDDAGTGASYLELAELIVRSASRPGADLRELRKRIVFSIAGSNSDDHLRNHGFLFDSRGWGLAPAHDIRPSPDSTGLSLAIDEHDNSPDLGLALSVAPQFRLTKPKAISIMEMIRDVTSTWRERAKALGIPKPEIGRMEGAFEHAR